MARPERSIPHLRDIFGNWVKPDEIQHVKEDKGGGGCDTAKRNKKSGKNSSKGQSEVKHLERHLSMKKTIRKKMMRDLQQAFVDNPEEFLQDGLPPELSSKEEKRTAPHRTNNHEPSFLEMLRAGSKESNVTDPSGVAPLLAGIDATFGAIHDTDEVAVAEVDAEDQRAKTSFWRRLAMKAARNKR